MGVSCRHEDRLLVLDCAGSFAHPEARDILRECLAKFPGIHPPALLICDTRSHFTSPSADVPYLAQYLADWKPKIQNQIALLVDSEVKFGVGRMIGTHCEALGVELRVFRDLEQAKKWLLQSLPVV